MPLVWINCYTIPMCPAKSRPDVSGAVVEIRIGRTEITIHFLHLNKAIGITCNGIITHRLRCTLRATRLGNSKHL